MLENSPIYLPKSGDVKSAVMMLHGYGSNGDDLISLASFFAADLPNTAFISPNAPFEMEMFYGGYEWFPLTDRDPVKMLAGARRVEPIMNAMIDEVLAEYKLPASKFALLGFSQGTMTSLFVAPRRAEPIAGIVGYSGALLSPELVSAETKSKPPVCLIHGDADDVVPFTAMAQAEKTLKENGFAIEAHRRPNLPHSIDMEGIEIAKGFLTKLL